MSVLVTEHQNKNFFFRRAAAIVNFCMHEHVQMRGECPGHLMNLNFSFDRYHNISIERFRGALRSSKERFN